MHRGVGRAVLGGIAYAAVTLRLWLVVLIPLLGGDFLRAYVIVPFLCWVPNLAIVELLLRRGRTEAADRT